MMGKNFWTQKMPNLTKFEKLKIRPQKISRFEMVLTLFCPKKSKFDQQSKK